MTLGRAVISMVLFLLTTNGEAAVRSQTTDYCLVEAIQADTGHGTSPIGDFTMKARLAVVGSHYVLDAWNLMPDNSQILSFQADGTYQRSGPTRIRFIDSFENRGRGTFTATQSEMQININQVTVADGGENIGRNYGSYKLFSRGCKWTPA